MTESFITVWMNAGSNTKRAGKTPTRLCKFNRFYPANKTFGKDTTNLIFCQVVFNKFYKKSWHHCQLSIHSFF